MMQRIGGAGQDGHDRLMRTVLVENTQFAPNNVYVVWGLNSKGHSAARHAANHDGDPVADYDLLANFSSERAPRRA